MTDYRVSIKRGLNEFKSLETTWSCLKEAEFYEQYVWHLHALEATRSKDALVVCFLEDEEIVAILPLYCYEEKAAGIKHRVIGSYKPDRISFYGMVCFRKPSASYPLSMVHEALRSSGIRYGYLSLNRVPRVELLNEVIDDRTTILKHAHAEKANVIEFKGGYEAYLKSLSRNRRQKIKQKYRRLSSLGQLEYQASSPENKREMFDWYLELEHSGWKGYRDTGNSLEKDVAQKEYFLEALKIDDMHIHALKINGDPVAAHISVASSDTLYMFKISYKEEYKDNSPGELLIIETIKYLEDKSVSSINLVTDLKWHSHISNSVLTLHQRRYYSRSFKGIYLFALSAISRMYKQFKKRSG